MTNSFISQQGDPVISDSVFVCGSILGPDLSCDCSVMLGPTADAVLTWDCLLCTG